MHINKLLSRLESWEATKKAFKDWGITTYVVEPKCVEFRVEGDTIYIPPEAETTVAALLQEDYRSE